MLTPAWIRFDVQPERCCTHYRNAERHIFLQSIPLFCITRHASVNTPVIMGTQIWHLCVIRTRLEPALETPHPHVGIVPPSNKLEKTVSHNYASSNSCYASHLRGFSKIHPYRSSFQFLTFLFCPFFFSGAVMNRLDYSSLYWLYHL